VPRKISFLEGLRGVAALQVLLLHYGAALFPVVARAGTTARYSWEPVVGNSPLFILLDGYSSVNLFFLLSGFVLARSFVRSDAGLARLVAKRFLRLGIPVCAALIVSVALLTLVPDVRAQAFRVSQSAWAAAYGNFQPIHALLTDAGVLTMLVGFSGLSLFDGWSLPGAIAPRTGIDAVNPPLWTLHVEFWGSLMVLGLAVVYRRSRWLGLTLLAVVFCATATSVYSLFLVGFAASVIFERWRPSAIPGTVVGIALLAVALLRDGVWTSQLFTWWYVHNKVFVVGPAALGATPIFFAVLIMPSVQRWLASSWAVWLGRISFSVYLLHFPILFTAGSVVLAGSAKLPYPIAAMLTVIVGFGLTFAAAALFERFVDRRAVVFSNRLTVGPARDVSPYPRSPRASRGSMRDARNDGTRHASEAITAKNDATDP
jgi:peptidoglycan/LPS O-acetylase OafA/YrhL